jgi:hypothetical protein
MAEGYAIVEALGFCTEYMQEYTTTARRVWDDKEDPAIVRRDPRRQRAHSLLVTKPSRMDSRVRGDQRGTIGRLEEVSSHHQGI